MVVERLLGALPRMACLAALVLIGGLALPAEAARPRRVRVTKAQPRPLAAPVHSVKAYRTRTGKFVPGRRRARADKRTSNNLGRVAVGARLGAAPRGPRVHR